MKILQTHRAFSLMEIMVAMALVGGLSYAIMSLTGNIAQSTKSAEAKTEELQIVRQMETLLINKENCESSFTSKTLSTSGTAISQLMKSNGTVAYQVGQTIGSGPAKMTLMSMNLKANAAVVNGLNGSVLEVTLRKDGIKNRPTVLARINLQVETSSNLISRCFADWDQAVNTAIKRMCENGGGVLNVSGQCEFKDYAGNPMDKTTFASTAFVSEFLKTVINSCPTGTYFAGIDAGNNAICKNLINPSKATCEAGAACSLSVINGQIELTSGPAVVTPPVACTPDCSSSGNICSGTTFTSSNNCGVCLGTKACGATLANGQHTEDQCITAGGQVTTMNGILGCAFPYTPGGLYGYPPPTECPSGWTSMNLSYYPKVTCTGSDQYMLIVSQLCSTGGTTNCSTLEGWMSSAPVCSRQVSHQSCLLGCNPCITAQATCTSSVPTKIGCY